MAFKELECRLQLVGAISIPKFFLGVLPCNATWWLTRMIRRYVQNWPEPKFCPVVPHPFVMLFLQRKNVLLFSLNWFPLKATLFTGCLQDYFRCELNVVNVFSTDCKNYRELIKYLAENKVEMFCQMICCVFVTLQDKRKKCIQRSSIF